MPEIKFRREMRKHKTCRHTGQNINGMFNGYGKQFCSLRAPVGGTDRSDRGGGKNHKNSDHGEHGDHRQHQNQGLLHQIPAHTHFFRIRQALLMRVTFPFVFLPAGFRSRSVRQIHFSAACPSFSLRFRSAPESGFGAERAK